MAKLNGEMHPNAQIARARPEAQRLCADRGAALGRRREIVSLRFGGLSVALIAEMFGISAGRVNQLLRASMRV